MVENEDEDEENHSNSSGLATYINQCQFRTTYNQKSNLDFYFSYGGLYGSKITRQLIHVMAMLVLVDVVNCGVTVYAGGNNAHFIGHLLGGTQEIKNAWMEIFSFKNCVSHHQYNCIVWVCSTHNLKSLRNQLLASSNTEKAKRIFHDVGNIFFGWKQVDFQ